MRISNKPNVSKAITFSYKILILFVTAIAIFFLYTAFFTPMGLIGIIAAAASAIVDAIILLILASLHQTRYILTDEELLIKTTRLVGGDKKIRLETIKSVEKTLIPFGVKLFGASFHGGYYYMPGLGRVFLSMTNFEDGLLIKTDNQGYVITASDPLCFKEAIENKIKGLENL